MPLINVGETAPQFELSDQDNQIVRLADYRGKQPVVLYFYPKDDTPGCTLEAISFRDRMADFKAAGVEILGISPDNVNSHRAFASKCELPFRILADPDHRVCELYGVWQEKNNYGKKYMGVARTTYILDRDGVVRRVYPKVKVDGHADAVLKEALSL